MKVQDVCKSYFSICKDITNYKKNSCQTNCLVTLKVVSYVLLVFPLLFGIAYGISSLHRKYHPKSLKAEDLRTFKLAQDKLFKPSNSTIITIKPKSQDNEITNKDASSTVYQNIEVIPEITNEGIRYLFITQLNEALGGRGKYSHVVHGGGKFYDIRKGHGTDDDFWNLINQLERVCDDLDVNKTVGRGVSDKALEQIVSYLKTIYLKKSPGHELIEAYMEIFFCGERINTSTPTESNQEEVTLRPTSKALILELMKFFEKGAHDDETRIAAKNLLENLKNPNTKKLYLDLKASSPTFQQKLEALEKRNFTPNKDLYDP